MAQHGLPYGIASGQRDRDVYASAGVGRSHVPTGKDMGIKMMEVHMARGDRQAKGRMADRLDKEKREGKWSMPLKTGR